MCVDIYPRLFSILVSSLHTGGVPGFGRNPAGPLKYPLKAASGRDGDLYVLSPKELH